MSHPFTSPWVKRRMTDDLWSIASDVPPGYRMSLFARGGNGPWTAILFQGTTEVGRWESTRLDHAITLAWAHAQEGVPA